MIIKRCQRRYFCKERFNLAYFVLVFLPTLRRSMRQLGRTVRTTRGRGFSHCQASKLVLINNKTLFTYFPSWQSYKTIESSSLLDITVSPFELKSKQLILSEFSRKTFATLKLRSTLSVSFMMPCLLYAWPGAGFPLTATANTPGAVWDLFTTIARLRFVKIIIKRLTYRFHNLKESPPYTPVNSVPEVA